MMNIPQQSVPVPTKQTNSIDPALNRCHPRHEVRALVKLEGMEPHNLNTTRSAQLFDISLGGASFLSDQPINLGTMWRLAILQNDQRTGTQSLDIRSCKKVDAHQYLIGAQFILEPYLLAMVGVNPHALTPQKRTQR